MKNLILLFLCCLGITAWAQQNTSSSNKQAQKAFEQANQLLTIKQYTKAIEKLQEAINADNKFLAAYQQSADVYRMLQQYENAKINYRKVIETDPEFYPLTYFGLAESELKTADYSNALTHFKKYSSYPNLSEKSKLLTAKYIADCEFSINAIQKPVPFNPKNLGASINTPASEYLPVVTADEENIIFTRRKNNNEDFYESKRLNFQWKESSFLSPNINTSTFNEGAQCISPDGMYLFFTGCNRPDGLGRCDIYVSRREGKEWSKPFNLGAPINGLGWESQPTISADGRTLYFVSTRAGGFGGYDIWKTTLQQGGEWSVPLNLGPNINTSFDEESPFIHPDGKTLYFSSTGWAGLGGRDVFVSRKDAADNWQKPNNLGYPINSHQDEGGLTVSTDGKTAYFSSDKKEGFGEMDIYSFELPATLRPNIVTYVKGNVFDAKTRTSLNANVKITELESGSLVFDDITDATTGHFLATMTSGKKYGLTVDKPGYLFYSENFALDKPGSINKPFLLDVPLQKIELGGMVVLNNIFFETNKADLLPESKSELQQLIAFLNNNPKVSIEISGHTDNIGEDKTNLILSENRAKTVYAFLISNKILPGRLSFKGYGETKPIADNTSAEGRQKNRRTEFKIVKY